MRFASANKLCMWCSTCGCFLGFLACVKPHAVCTASTAAGTSRTTVKRWTSPSLAKTTATATAFVNIFWGREEVVGYHPSSCFARKIFFAGGFMKPSPSNFYCLFVSFDTFNSNPRFGNISAFAEVRGSNPLRGVMFVFLFLFFCYVCIAICNANLKIRSFNSALKPNLNNLRTSRWRVEKSQHVSIISLFTDPFQFLIIMKQSDSSLKTFFYRYYVIIIIIDDKFATLTAKEMTSLKQSGVVIRM